MAPCLREGFCFFIFFLMFRYVTQTPWKHFRMHQVRQQQDKEGRRGRNTTLLHPPNAPAFLHYVHCSFPYRTGVGIYSVVGGYKGGKKKKSDQKVWSWQSVSGLKPSSLKRASRRPQRPSCMSGWSQQQLCRAHLQPSNSLCCCWLNLHPTNVDLEKTLIVLQRLSELFWRWNVTRGIYSIPLFFFSQSSLIYYFFVGDFF